MFSVFVWPLDEPSDEVQAQAETRTTCRPPATRPQPSPRSARSGCNWGIKGNGRLIPDLVRQVGLVDNRLLAFSKKSADVRQGEERLDLLRLRGPQHASTSPAHTSSHWATLCDWPGAWTRPGLPRTHAPPPTDKSSRRRRSATKNSRIDSLSCPTNGGSSAYDRQTCGSSPGSTGASATRAGRMFNRGVPQTPALTRAFLPRARPTQTFRARKLERNIVIQPVLESRPPTTRHGRGACDLQRGYRCLATLYTAETCSTVGRLSAQRWAAREPDSNPRDGGLIYSMRIGAIVPA